MFDSPFPDLALSTECVGTMEAFFELVLCAQREVIDSQRLLDEGVASRDVCQKHLKAVSLLRKASARVLEVAGSWDAYDSARGHLLKEGEERVGGGVIDREAYVNAARKYFCRWVCSALRTRMSRGLREAASVREAANAVRARCEEINAQRAVQRYNLSQMCTEVTVLKLLSRYWRYWHAVAARRAYRGFERNELSLANQVVGRANRERVARQLLTHWRFRLSKLETAGLRERGRHALVGVTRELKLAEESIGHLQSRCRSLEQALSLEAARWMEEMGRIRSELVASKGECSQWAMEGRELRDLLAVAVGRCTTLELRSQQAEEQCRSWTSLAERTMKHFSTVCECMDLHARRKTQTAQALIKEGEMVVMGRGVLAGWRRWVEGRTDVHRRADRLLLKAGEELTTQEANRHAHCNAHTSLESQYRNGYEVALGIYRGRLDAMSSRREARDYCAVGGPLASWGWDASLLSNRMWSIQLEEAHMRCAIVSEGLVGLVVQDRVAFANRSVGAIVGDMQSKWVPRYEMERLEEFCDKLISSNMMLNARWCFEAWRRCARQRSRMRGVGRARADLSGKVQSVRSSLRSLRDSLAIKSESMLVEATRSMKRICEVSYCQGTDSRAELRRRFHAWMFWAVNGERLRLSSEVGRLTSRAHDLERVIAKALETERSSSLPGKLMGDVVPRMTSSTTADPEAQVCDGMLDFSRGVNNQISMATAVASNADSVVNRIHDITEMRGNEGNTVADDVTRIASELRVLLADLPPAEDVTDSTRADF